MARVLIGIRGMNDTNDPERVEAALNDLEGVSSASVSLRDRQAAVEYDEGQLTTFDLVRALRNEGFKAGME